MTIGNINAKIDNRMTKMWVVDSQCQHPFMVACLLNGVSLRGNTCITIVLLMHTLRLFFKFNMTKAFHSHPGIKSPLHGQTIVMFLVFIVDSVYCMSVIYRVCTGQCFLTEICSDTQLMQKYRDISFTPCYPSLCVGYRPFHPSRL